MYIVQTALLFNTRTTAYYSLLLETVAPSMSYFLKILLCESVCIHCMASMFYFGNFIYTMQVSYY